MNLSEAASVIRRLDAIWPLGADQGVDARNEWLNFLAGLDYDAALEAVAELRAVLKWRPSMAELKCSVGEALVARDDALPPLLPGKVDADAPTLADLYGAEQGDWVYCWRCDMAIGLADRADGAVHLTPRLGIAHRFCPKSGSAPHIPEYQRAERADYWTKHHVRRPS